MRLGKIVGFTAAVLLALFTASCGSSTASAPLGSVSVLYAGSLVTMMENNIGPSFTKAANYTYLGEGKGSVALANEIKGKLRRPDIFISADPSVNGLLTGAANGNYVSWYIPFASSSLVIGYNPNSSFAAQFQAAQSGSIPWWQVLEKPGLRLGRTDPAIDPKGVFTILAFELAQKYYNQPNLSTAILGSAENTAQIFPEEELVSRLQSGQLDAGIFYSSEVTALKIPYITLPDQINFGNPQYAAYYSQATYTTASGKITKGAPIEYTITIPSTSQDPKGAIAFVRYFLGAAGTAILKQYGLTLLPLSIVGSGAPPEIVQLAQGS